MSEKGKGIVVAPYWQAQPWFPVFMKLCISELIILEPKENLLICPYENRSHNLSTKITLMAAVLSANTLIR